MKYWKIILVLSIILLAGCQQENGEMNKEKGADAPQKAEDQVGKYGVPYSNGPTAGPETMKGPTAPPPETPTAQAVTTKENIRLTLPLKTE